MPIYEYRCLACGNVFSLFFVSYKSATSQELCSLCGSEQTERLISSFAIGGRADPGPGRAAWPTSWSDTHSGDPETLNYWRHRIEREARLEEKYPELRNPSLAQGNSASSSGTAEQSQSHNHDEHSHHHHHHEHPHVHETNP